MANSSLDGPVDVAAPLPNLSLALPEPILTLLLSTYIPVVILAVFGSLLVILSVIRSPSLRTSSNFYLVNLALSDLLLAGLTCPITLSQLAFKSWQLPLYPALCSLSSFLPIFFSFASTFTITVIALDRHRLIVHTSQPQYRSKVACLIVLGVWFAAFLCSAPILPNTRLVIHTLPAAVSALLGLSHRAYCTEDWVYPKGRLLYSIAILSVQLLLPSAILVMAHVRIYKKLKSLPFWSQRNRGVREPDVPMMDRSHAHRGQDRAGQNNRRGSRTLYLLICVVVVFVISWLPLNTLNLLMDLGFKDNIFGLNEVKFRLAFSLCHLLGMSSAISNPLIYGYFNQGFREEFWKILVPCKN